MKDGAVLYCRVSTEDQVGNNSLPIQLKDCRKAATQLECTVLKEFVEEGESGAKKDRTQMINMLNFCVKNSHKIRYIIVKDIDRFSRDTLVHGILRAQFRELGIELYSVNQPTIADGTIEAGLFETVFSAFAQFERLKILQRTKKGSMEVIARGGWTSKPPYGYRQHRRSDNLPTLIVHPEEAKAVVRAFELYAEGMNLKEATAKLNALGFRSPRGKKLSFQTVHNILHNPAYIAKIQNKSYPDQLLDAVHPSIITVSLWNKVQSRLIGKGTRPTRQKFNPAFPLTTILRCYLCNTPLTGSASTNKAGKKYAYYHCRNGKCKAKNTPKETMEKEFLKALGYIQVTQECMDYIEKNIIGTWRGKWLRQTEENRRLDKELIRLKEKKDQVEDKYISGHIPKDTYDRHLLKVSEEIANIDAVREKLLISEERLRGLLKFARDFLTSISNTWENAVPMRKRLIQKLVFPVGLRLESATKLGTLELPPMLALSKIPVSESSKLAAPRGIEPRFPG